MIEEIFNPANKVEYFASRALYKKWEDSKGNTHEKMFDDADCTFIRKARGGETGVKLLQTFDTETNGIIEKFMFIPPLVKKKRQCVYCQGQAGGGKSYLLDDYVDWYKMINPRNEVMYFTLNTAEVDVSLNLRNYKIVDMHKFFTNLQSISNNLNAIKKIAYEFQNKLLVFDDVGNLKNDKHIQKTFWNFIDQSIENFRKFDVNVYIIAHSSRTGNYGTIMKEEMTNYVISGNSMQTRNDRILSAYFGMSDSQIDDLLDHTDRWVCINTTKCVAIYPSQIVLLK